MISLGCFQSLWTPELFDFIIGIPVMERPISNQYTFRSGGSLELLPRGGQFYWTYQIRGPCPTYS